VPLGAFRSDTPGCTPAALATPPGSLFAHSEHSKAVVARALVPPQQRDEANEAAAPVVSVRAPETFSRMIGRLSRPSEANMTTRITLIRSEMSVSPIFLIAP
jgi:hypothetical protein